MDRSAEDFRSLFGFQLVEDLENLLHSGLFKAAYTGNLNLFKGLALKHAENEGIGVTEAIKKLTLEDGRGSLHFAAAGGSLKVCKYLLEELKLDVDSKDGEGSTPLCQASEKGHFDTVRYLLEKGADPDASNDKNVTPLHFAAMSGDTNIITLLLSRGVRIDVVTSLGTALQFAAGHGQQDAVKVLLDHGANPNVVNSQGMLRPLFSTIYLESWECMKLLLQAGADPNVVAYGDTPLTLVARNGRVDDIMRLLEAGADPNYKMNAGLTALEVAAVFCNYQVLGVLFPVTSRVPSYPDWSMNGLMRHLNSDAIRMQRGVHAKERFLQAKSKGKDAFQGEQYLVASHWFRESLVIFPKDALVLSNMSACYARLDDGINALEYATKCMHERPEWPKAYYRIGVALNLQKRYGDAADAFNKGLTLDPENEELKDAYMNAIEARINSIKGDDFSNTIFVDDSPPNKNNVPTAREDNITPGRSQPACESGRRTVRPDSPSESFCGPQAPSDFGLLGAGLDSRLGENENATVRRPHSVPHPDVDTGFGVPASRVPNSPLNEFDYRQLLGTMTENCNQLLKSVARLDSIQSSASDIDASVRCEVGELRAANAKLSTSITSMAEELDVTKGLLKSVRSELQQTCEDKANIERLLHTQTLELSKVKQELFNSHTRESELQSSLNEVERALGKAPRR